MRERLTDMIIAALSFSLALNKWRLWELQERAHDAASACFFAGASLVFAVHLVLNWRSKP